MLDPKGRVEGAFNSFAEVYEGIAGKSMTFFTDLLIRDLQIPENPAVIDVGCGTGISTFQLMQRVQGRGKFCGIDISQKMLDLARARAADLGYANVESSKGDAEQLDFPESSFDLAISNQARAIVTGAFHKVNGRREWDPVIDDLSLVLQAKDGLVLVTGCCHAGLLNTCARATRLFNRRIIAILGGTHMVEYLQEDVDHVGEVLEKVYGTPELYLNHCTGKDAIVGLRGRFGPEVVHDCHVGTEVVFKT